MLPVVCGARPGHEAVVHVAGPAARQAAFGFVGGPRQHPTTLIASRHIDRRTDVYSPPTKEADAANTTPGGQLAHRCT